MSHRAIRLLLLGTALIMVAGLTGTAAALQPNLTYSNYLTWPYPVFPRQTATEISRVIFKYFHIDFKTINSILLFFPVDVR